MDKEKDSNQEEQFEGMPMFGCDCAHCPHSCGEIEDEPQEDEDKE